MKSSRFTFPLQSIQLPAVEFDWLYKTAQWLQDMPDWIELDEHTWDHVHERIGENLHEAFHKQAKLVMNEERRNHWYVASVEIDPDHSLVALFDHDENGDAETRVRVTRGPDLKRKGRGK